jgi:hypothetical protein
MLARSRAGRQRPNSPQMLTATPAGATDHPPTPARLPRFFAPAGHAWASLTYGPAGHGPTAGPRLYRREAELCPSGKGDASQRSETSFTMPENHPVL